MLLEITTSELIDKYTILQIKQANGLNVDVEMPSIENKVYKVLDEYPVLNYLMNILHCINEQMWVIEDRKREREETKEFDNHFINLSRSIYMINDERARVKRMIDKLSNSDYQEQKKHREYL
jgi:hypothetical protein